MTIVEMIVHMDCAGCENKIKKALKKLKGVDDIDVDINMQKVTVMGWADQNKVLRTVRKTGKRAELWPYPYNPENAHNLSVQHYNNQHHHQYHRHHDQYQSQPNPFTTYSSISNNNDSAYSYNYYKHGRTGQDYGYYQPPAYSAMFNEQDTAVFSDENPNACSIM